MRFFMSGTPRNDEHQDKEDGLCTHRLFSLHGEYKRAVLRWVQNAITEMDRRELPRTLMLDSGAFTAWNKGHTTSVEQVIDSYGEFMDIAKGAFDNVYMINLDVIPGERGRDPTLEELKEAVRVSDINFKILTDRFGPVVLPVYHQGESEERLYQVEEQAEYICVSPRNDLHEAVRVTWSAKAHSLLKEGTRTHGLATTGNKMLLNVPWWSADSAAWVLHGGYGKLDIYIDGKYTNVFLSDDAGKDRYFDQHYNNFADPIKRKIEGVCEHYGFSLEQVKGSGRLRGIVNMGELIKFADHVKETGVNVKVQDTLFGV